MSIMTLNTNNYSNLINGIRDIKRIWSLSDYFEMTDTGGILDFYKDLGLSKTINRLYNYNDITYCERYNEPFESLKLVYNNKEGSTNKYQTLKTLQCLQSNIDSKLVEESGADTKHIKRDLEALKTIIEGIKNNIICESKEYENSYWG